MTLPLQPAHFACDHQETCLGDATAPKFLTQAQIKSNIIPKSLANKQQYRSEDRLTCASSLGRVLEADDL